MSRRKSPSSGSCGEPTDTGLSPLIVPEVVTVDIVFIHGFTGHPVRTWTHKKAFADSRCVDGSSDSYERAKKAPRTLSSVAPSKKSADREKTCWPRHLLPEILPTARVLVYGYDTKLRFPSKEASSSHSTILDFATDFLQRLEATRRSHPSRCLIIVAHSLGGLIAKEALRQARFCENPKRQPYYRCLYDSITALLFFGTPHSGADPRGWLELGIEKLARAVGVSANEPIVNFLLPNSEWLIHLRDNFVAMLDDRAWIIYSFQEDHGCFKLGGKKVVEDGSSCLGNSRLETKVKIAADHMQMCRFKGFDDPEYQKVVDALNHIQQHIETESTPKPMLESINAHIVSNATMKFSRVRSSLETDNFRSLRESLWYSAVDAHYNDITHAYAGTCDWFWRTDEYQNWLCANELQAQRNILCIEGKPGSGKSVLMKHVAKTQQTRTNILVISFFFNAQGAALERSITGMYRSLLHQILESAPDLRLATEGPRSDVFHKNEGYEWTVGDLQTLFEHIVEALGRRRITCYIDALDECETGQVPDLLDFLQSIVQIASSSQLQFLVCFSSRHYPFHSIEYSFKIDLESHRQHALDITKYINGNLRIGQSARAEKIKNEILRRSSSIFLWVLLVVRILNGEYGGGHMDILEQRLKVIPDKLEKLFEDILERDADTIGELDSASKKEKNKQSREQLVLCLQWLLYTARPLRREELYIGILSRTNPKALSRNDTTPEDMDRFIVGCSKGLVEMTKHQVPTVRFLHESFREFLLGRTESHTFNSELVPGLSHDGLGECCKAYLELVDFRKLPQSSSTAASEDPFELQDCLSRRYPCLQYFVQNLFHHKDKANGHGISQGAFLENFDRTRWIILDNAFQKAQSKRHSPTASLLYILAGKNLSNLTRTYLRVRGDSPKHDIEQREPDHHKSPLFAAIANSNCNENMLMALFNPEKRPPYENPQLQKADRSSDDKTIMARIEAILPNKWESDQNPGCRLIHWAVRKSESKILDWLLLEANVDPFYQDHNSLTPLHYAIKDNNESAKSALLSRMLSSNSEAMEIDLLHPTEKEWGRLLDLITARRISVDLKFSDGQTLLSCAVLNGDAELANALLSTGASALIADSRHRSPLSYAAERGYDGIVKSMLVRSTDAASTQAIDCRMRSPLSYAAEQGHKEIVRLLLSQSNDVNSKDSAGFTPIAYAAERRHDDVFDLLRHNGADMDAFAIWLREEIETHARDEWKLQSLLRQEAYLQGQTLDFAKVLYNAVNAGLAGMVDLALLRGANPNRFPVTYTDQSPLLKAIWHNNLAVVDVLLARGADPNARDPKCKTPLMRACFRGQHEVAALLLQNGASVNLIDPNGCTALEFAVKNGHKGIGEFLRSNGGTR